MPWTNHNAYNRPRQDRGFEPLSPPEDLELAIVRTLRSFRTFCQLTHAEERLSFVCAIGLQFKEDAVGHSV